MSVAAKGEGNYVGQMFHPQPLNTQTHYVYKLKAKPKGLYILTGHCTVATHRQCSASVVTKCRKFMPDSAVVVRKYILILWSPLLHCWSKKAPGSEVKGTSDLKLISCSSQCDSSSSSWCVLQDFFTSLCYLKSFWQLQVDSCSSVHSLHSW